MEAKQEARRLIIRAYKILFVTLAIVTLIQDYFHR